MVVTTTRNIMESIIRADCHRSDFIQEGRAHGGGLTEISTNLFGVEEDC